MWKKWSNEEIEDIVDNYNYYMVNKTEAVNTFGCSFSTIRRKAIGLDVNPIFQMKSNEHILSSLNNYINGLLLSDAGLTNIQKGTESLYQFCKHKEWLEKIQSDLFWFGVESKIDSGKHYFNKKYNIRSFGYRLTTSFYKEFKELRDKWYKEWYDDPNDESEVRYIKMIPRDIILNQECIANLYLGDGGIYEFKSGRSYYIYLATNKFIKEDNKFLLNKLREDIITTGYITKSNQIQFGYKNDVTKFLNYIKDYKVECYNYKFPEVLICE